MPAVLCLGLFAAAPLGAQEPVHLGFIGPLSGPSARAGEQMRRGIELYLEEANAAGGVDGHRITLQTHDDRDDPQAAHAQALEVAQAGEAVALIAHSSSAAAISAGPVYRAYRMPVVTPTAVHVDVTRANPWYFRTIYNARVPAQTMATYVQDALEAERAAVVHESADYGRSLAELFSAAAAQRGLDVAHTARFDHDDPHLQRRFEQIVERLGEVAPDVVYLAAKAPQAAELVRRLRRAGISVPVAGASTLAQESFSSPLTGAAAADLRPGALTENLWVAAPLLFDTANEQAQQLRERFRRRYGEEPDWTAAYAYDTAKVLVEALRRSDAMDAPDMAARREALRAALAAMDAPENAVRGATGHTWFDAEGDAVKPTVIGRYAGDRLIAAYTQYEPVHEGPATFADASQALPPAVSIGGRPHYRTHVVHTGLRFNEISDFQRDTGTVRLDFHLWFRFTGGPDPGDVAFPNAAEPVELGPPVESQTFGRVNYRAYHVEGRFQTNFVPLRAVFEQQVLGVSLRHRTAGRDRLVYVLDELGMALQTPGLVAEKLSAPEALRLTGWRVDDALIYQEPARHSALGDPRFLGNAGQVDFSRFIATVRVSEKVLSARRLLGPEELPWLLAAGLVGVLLLHLVRRRMVPRVSFGFIWALRVLLTLAVLWLGETVVLNNLLRDYDARTSDAVVNIFAVLWWLVPAFYLVQAANYFLWIPLEERTEQPVPRLVRYLTTLFIYIVALLGVLAYVFDQPITSLLATSGIIAIIIGLALQVNLSNIFSGLALNIERPFNVGDWVKIGDAPDGRVLDITWRATRLRGKDGSQFTIANNEVNAARVSNYTRGKPYWMWPEVHVDPKHPPARVKKVLLDAVLAVKEHLVSQPAPHIIFSGVNEWAATYLVVYGIRDYTYSFYAMEAVWESVWAHLNRAGIEPAVQRQHLHLFRGRPERGETALEPLTLINEIDAFRPFPDETKAFLAEHMLRRHFQPGTMIMEQGEEGHTFYLLAEGVVAVMGVMHDGRTVEITRLGAGAFFGETALLTGRPRSATVRAVTQCVVYEVDRATFTEALERAPEITGYLDEVSNMRQLMTDIEMGRWEASIGAERQPGNLLRTMRRLLRRPRDSGPGRS